MTSSLSHVEIRVADLRKARAFYGSIFGWTFEPGSADRLFFNTGGNPDGALVQVERVPSGGNVVLYLRARDDADRAEKESAIARHGGRILAPKAPHPIPHHGFVTRFADPFGNEHVLWTPK